MSKKLEDKVVTSTLIGWGSVTIDYKIKDEGVVGLFLDVFESGSIRDAFNMFVDLDSKGIITAKKPLTHDEMDHLSSLIISGESVDYCNEIERKYRSEYLKVIEKSVSIDEASSNQKNLEIKEITKKMSSILGCNDSLDSKKLENIVNMIVKRSFFTNGESGISVSFLYKENCTFPSTLSDNEHYNLQYHFRYHTKWAFSNESIKKLVDAIILGDICSEKYCFFASGN